MRIAVGIGLCLYVMAWILPRDAGANEFAKFLDEYVCNPIRQYQPNDPWTRSRFYQVQNGYAGLFRDCDNEEQKRCSPYICWKYSHCPTVRERFIDFISPDLDQVKQRIKDGAGACCGSGSPGVCSCSKCVNRQVANGSRQLDQIAKRDPAADRNGPGPNCKAAARQPKPITTERSEQFSVQFVASHSFAVDPEYVLRKQPAANRNAKANETVIVNKSASQIPNHNLIQNKIDSKAPIVVADRAESNDHVPPWRAKTSSRR